jgi:hypothetical protein
MIGSTLGAAMVHASSKSGSRKPVLGTGDFTYEAIHGWGELPDHVKWGETHGVTVDAEEFIYVKHRNSSPGDPMDAIVVFDPAGKYVRSFGKEYHGGGHGIDVRREGSEEFLYLCDVKNRLVAKTRLSGEHLWTMQFPEQAGVYQKLEQFNPTNVAFAPDGGFYVADGYGSSYIHRYDKDARWVQTWGGAGTEEGKMRTPHGIWLDDRAGREPTLIVADRANARLQSFSLDGKFLSIVGNVSFPAHFDIRGGTLLVPDLHARVTLFDEKNEVIVHLGYEQAWTEAVLADGMKLRSQPDRWEAGRFIHPHDACFDSQGNIFVVEWVPTGRITLLRKV